MRAAPQLIATVVAYGVDANIADAVSRAVIAELHTLVADEADDVAAVLPASLLDLWEAAPAQ